MIRAVSVMNVAIDTNPYYTSRAGVCRYVSGLLHGLRQIDAPDLNLTELAWPVENYGFAQPMRAFKTVYRDLVWGQTHAPRIMQGRASQLLHTTSNVVFGRPKGVKLVHTLYDLAVLRQPERFRPWQRRACVRQLTLGLRDAEKIICISRFTADEAMALTSIPASKLVVVHCGFDLVALNASGTVMNEELPDVPDEFFLFVGSLEPGKNLDLLKRVYALSTNNGIALPPLVIVGVRREGVRSEGPAPHDWRYLGRQSDAALAKLYGSALALVFPTQYEGFGLPLLEAMAHACPVICSPVASLPEVGGDAVLYAEQTPSGYLEVMQQIQRDEALRQDIVLRGRKRLQHFSWQKSAETTYEVYREILQ